MVVKKGTRADEKDTRADKKGTRADKKDTRADGNDTRADEKGRRADGKGRRADEKETRADGKGTRADEKNTTVHKSNQHAAIQKCLAATTTSYAEDFFIKFFKLLNQSECYNFPSLISSTISGFKSVLISPKLE